MGGGGGVGDLPENLMTESEKKHAARRNDGFAMIVIMLRVDYIVVGHEMPRITFGAREI
jgi:hypothetical protein